MNRFTIIAALMGFALIVAGATYIYRPAGLLTGGFLLLLAAHGSMRMPHKD
jgi:preprotein translocase subunit SecD